MLFFAWLFGVPFLLLVGLIRRVAAPTFGTRAAAEAFAATTDTLLVTALVANLILPVSGLLLARYLGERFWRRHFGAATALMPLVFVGFALLQSAASAPLIGTVPPDREPPPAGHCIPISGGRGCPGG
jgi:hypothetical protein